MVYVPEGQGFVHGARGHMIAAKLGGQIHLAHIRRTRDTNIGVNTEEGQYAAQIDGKTYYFDIDQSPGFVHLRATPA